MSKRGSSSNCLWNGFAVRATFGETPFPCSAYISVVLGSGLSLSGIGARFSNYSIMDS